MTVIDEFSLPGYYAYIESSNGRMDDKSYLRSLFFPPSAGGNCFSFWYNMYGEAIGSLRILVEVGVYILDET